MSRWHVGCDRCDAGGWIGRREAAVDAWCEGCQRGAVLAGDAGAGSRCGACGQPLTLAEPRFLELYGELQNLGAVLSAWDGEVGPLAALLPDRPRFLTDLNPPPPRSQDASAAREALATLARGEFTAARALLEQAVARTPGDARLHFALGIAAQRLGEQAVAEAAFGRALAGAESAAARVARGTLRAWRGEFAGAREDFARAGDRREGRWNRAALLLVEAVTTTGGLPASEVVQAARREAGEPSPYWSEHTVGRLLWTLLVERAAARAGSGAPECPDERTLGAAERELEFDTFWDRALVVEGYARLGLARETEAAASSLALERALALLGEPCVAGEAGRPLAAALERVAAAVKAGEPAVALAAVQEIARREDLRRFRVPCLRCGHGTLGVDRVEEDEEGD